MPTSGTTRAAATMQVPMLDLQAQYRPIRDAAIDAVTRVCDSQRFIMGPEVEGMEREMASFLGVAHAVGVSSGTDALLLAMMALGIGPGDEVITSTYSFFATAGCVARLGATPVFVDIDPVTYNIDPAATAAAVTPRTRAILPVHLYGQSADIDPLLAIAARAGVPVIEDAAQAIGADVQGPHGGRVRARRAASRSSPARTWARSATAGSSRRTTTTWPRGSAACGCTAPTASTTTRSIGGNFRLDALQAAVLRVKLPHLAAWTEARRRNAARYDRAVRRRRPGRSGDAAGRQPRPVSHLQPVRHPGAGPRRGQGPPGIAPGRERDLLSRSVPRAGVLRVPRLPGAASSRTPSGPPARRWPCRSTASSPPTSNATSCPSSRRRSAGPRECPHPRAGAPEGARPVKAASPDAQPAAPARRSRIPGVTTQIFIGLFIGVAIGYVWPAFGVSIKPLADAFLRMIKMIIAPLLFSTLVVGIAGHGRPEGHGAHRPQGDHLLRGGDDDCALLGPGAGQLVPAWGRPRGADRRRHRRTRRPRAEAAARLGHLPAPVPHVGRRRDGAAATSCSWSSSRRSSASRSRPSASGAGPSSRCSRARPR